MDLPKRPGQRANGQRLTRRRIPLSCVACRVRKLKCNREKPCQNCIVRGESNAASCTYAEKAEKKNPTKANPRSDAENMRKRLNRLENSILSIISSDEKNASQSKQSKPYLESGESMFENPIQAGGQRISRDTRSTHWDAILNDLGAMKDAWSEENDKIEFSTGSASPVTKDHRPSLLSGLTQPPDRSTIVGSLPSRETADRLVARFFESYNPATPARYVLHKATFLRQYNKYWTDPSKSKIIWIGLLFGILCIAMQSYTRANEVPPEYEGTAPALIQLYRVRTAQCLTIADLTKPVDFMVETLYLYASIEYADERDGDMGSYLLSGTMMRLALQQGYHRDPSQFPNLSVFQGEMRRRIWSAVNQHDLLFSVLIGLPKCIRYAECDTQPPRNLHEEELYEDMKELPPSRPVTEDTEVSYQVVKLQVMRAYGHVTEFLNLLEPQPYDEVLKLDLKLMEARANIPPHLQLRTLEEMANDPPSRIMERFIPQLFYHKAVCLLHRKYWDSVPPEACPPGTWSYSRKSCVNSSLALLEHQATMHRASQPGGILEKFKWYHFSITNHDFLLAAMILCLDIMSIVQRGDRPDILEWFVTESEKLQAIEGSRAIWAETIEDCRDAKRAVSILTSVLNKLSAKKEEQKKKTSNISETQNNLSASATNPNVDSLRYSPYFTDQFGLGIPLIAGSLAGVDVNMETDFLDTLGSDLTAPGDFNWVSSCLKS
ncbi:hypothetical protein N431DRAFT_332569 [Stipitochalara longipes BDJ]|nr:hypothetical protein N431DRAFT_332569 [Stipitochalara longipes BDJ]